MSDEPRPFWEQEQARPRREQDPALRQCARDGCLGAVPHPTQRSRPVAADYCSAECIPGWLRHLPASYVDRPTETWLRSGAPTAEGLTRAGAGAATGSGEIPVPRVPGPAVEVVREPWDLVLDGPASGATP
ncbi:MAG TPA: hypothetical protein VGH76_25195 [Actinomycetospora sp.]|uniref:hypothetical protein n=1 Tax=Actinomycetospora sp. TaxID=1872135 RepID=UPI002F4233E5